jgi:hypothetical protein
MSIRVVWTQEKKDKAIEKLTEYFEEHGIGEMIMQNDEALIMAPEILADIADDILIYREGIIFEDNDDD